MYSLSQLLKISYKE